MPVVAASSLLSATARIDLPRRVREDPRRSPAAPPQITDPHTSQYPDTEGGQDRIEGLRHDQAVGTEEEREEVAQEQCEADGDDHDLDQSDPSLPQWVPDDGILGRAEPGAQDQREHTRAIQPLRPSVVIAK